MNIRKATDYSTMYSALNQLMAEKLPQVEQSPKERLSKSLRALSQWSKFTAAHFREGLLE